MKIIKNFLLFFFIIFCFKSLSGKIELYDDTGNLLKLQRSPSRIIVLSPEINEIIFDIGKGNLIIANTEYCDFPEKSKKIKKVGSFSNPDIEKIIKLNPDLIFLTKGIQNNILIKLKKLNLKFFTIYINSIDKLFASIQKISLILNASEEGKFLITKMKKKLKKVKKLKRRITILPLLWSKPVMVAGKGTLVNDIIKKAGAYNILDKYEKGGYFVVSDEFLLNNIPDYYLLCDKNITLNNRIFKIIKKKKNIRSIKINPDLILRATPRTIDGILTLNEILRGRSIISLH